MAKLKKVSSNKGKLLYAEWKRKQQQTGNNGESLYKKKSIWYFCSTVTAADFFTPESL